jgi:hypothetical protein
MIYKLAEAAEKSWRRLDGHNLLPKLILGVKFADGIEIKSQTQAAAVIYFKRLYCNRANSRLCCREPMCDRVFDCDC